MIKSEIEILKKSLFELGNEEIEKYLSLPDENIELSKSLENKIKEISKKRKAFFYNLIRTIPRKIAVILIASIIIFSMAMGISAIRKPIISFFINIEETFIKFYAIEQDNEIYIPKSIEKMYLPTFIPNEYIMVDSQKTKSSATTIWMCDTALIIFEQDIIVKSQTYIDNEDVKYQSFLLEENEVHYYIKAGNYFLIWTDGAYLYSIICSEDIKMDEIKAIISSIEPQ